MALNDLDLNNIAQHLVRLLQDAHRLRARDAEAIAVWAEAFVTNYASFEGCLRDGHLHYRTRAKIESIRGSLKSVDELARSLVERDTRTYERDQLIAAFLDVAVAAHSASEQVLRYYARQPRQTQSRPRASDAAGRDGDVWDSDNNYRGDVVEYSMSLRMAADNAATRNCRMVPVHFGTSRARSPDKLAQPRDTFVPGRGESKLSVGVADVSIPVGHRMGKIEAPGGIWRFKLAANPEKHVTLCDVTVLAADEWVASARAEVGNSDSKGAFLFIHGFNVSFEEAMSRAAQIAFDVDYKGVISAFSWGSEGRVLGYMADEVSVRLATPALCEFLRMLRNDVGVEHIDVVGHSMGCRALLAALQEMPGAQDTDPFPWGQVIFAAPDVDAQEYEAGIGKARNNARRYTLYGSQRDWALVVSRALRSDFPRAGEGGKRILVTSSVETIDATQVGGNMFGLGHSYIGSQRSILTDLANVLMGYAMPRAGLTPKEHRDGRYWVFRA